MLSNSMVHAIPEAAHNYLDGQIMPCFHRTQRLIIVYFGPYASSIQFTTYQPIPPILLFACMHSVFSLCVLNYMPISLFCITIITILGIKYKLTKLLI
jgi:hypothetical protein